MFICYNCENVSRCIRSGRCLTPLWFWAEYKEDLMSWTRSVFSSSATQVGYDDETGEMLVTWKNGKVSAYKVSEDVADEVSRAASVGGYINDEIKPHFPHRYR